MTAPAESIAAVPDPDAWKLFVFRKNRAELSTYQLVKDLAADLRSVSSRCESIIDALVRAGEIETGVADSGWAETGEIAAIVDEIASAACANDPYFSPAAILHRLEQIILPATIHCSHPEGFSYYGLHPLDFADLARRVLPELAPVVAVIGIRTAGSTLSAVVSAVLRAHKIEVERTTVRPEGEPYLRRARFSDSQLQWIQERLRQSADFVIVDEGPGFSGSTFLSVASALGDAGVPNSRTLLLCSRPLNEAAAGAAQAASWAQYRSYAIEYGTRTPHDAAIYVGSGLWRERLYTSQSHWPACWTQMERSKHLSADGRCLLKFEGFGRYGRLANDQAVALAQEGLAPALAGFENGYARYELVKGSPLARQDVSAGLLSRIASYCAFRAKNFPTANTNSQMLSNMMEVNTGVEFGESSTCKDIPVELPVYPDGRMMPHEWLVTAEGRVIKTDAVGHAEGHQLPGPADIAWDLAGAVIEWQLTADGTEFLLNEYRRLSGDDPRRRMQCYLVLYCVHRMAHCRMGAAAMATWPEARYLFREYQGYARQFKVTARRIEFTRTSHYDRQPTNSQSVEG
ncbi:MAG TPA: hypothetical protein VG488_12940 [Candidatus Angelobacter sp.]|jgi:hypothetical protein|nr:hypothetical protein [Candidatus Angelobacter sp.]